MVQYQAELVIFNSVIKDNTDWGVTAVLEKCGFFSDNFTGQVMFQGNNQIYSNNTSGNQNSMGNPGNHPGNRPDVSDGQVCLPRD